MSHFTEIFTVNMFDYQYLHGILLSNDTLISLTLHVFAVLAVVFVII